LARHVAHRLAILARPRPRHRSARFQVHLEVRAHEDFLVRFLRYESIPDLFQRRRNVVSENQWWPSHINSSESKSYDGFGEGWARDRSTTARATAPTMACTTV